MPYDSKAVANYFLDRADQSGKKLDPMQLLKLVYFAHGWYLADSGAPLIDEMVEAWRYGPVIPSLYHEFKAFGKNPITRKASNLIAVDKKSWDYVLVEPLIEDAGSNSKTGQLLGVIWNT